eukprot:7934330-Pyramimonas_sp.AAC.1
MGRCAAPLPRGSRRRSCMPDAPARQGSGAAVHLPLGKWCVAVVASGSEMSRKKTGGEPRRVT